MTDPKKPRTLHPVDPSEGLPSLRAPRVPKFDPKADTIRSPPPPDAEDSGDRSLTDSMERILAETTPAHTPSSRQLLADTLKAAQSAAQHAANAADVTMAMHDEFRKHRESNQRDHDRFDKRLSSLELSQRWAPLAIAVVAIGLSIWQAFELQSLRNQLQLLQRVTYVPTESTVAHR